MCGVFGWVTYRRCLTESELRAARRALSSLSHRGPDQQGEWYDDHVYMGHRRLSIIDLSAAARQPFQDKEGRYVLAFNGEIYNYVELRSELEQEGAHFRTSSDTEVMLAALDRWGDRAFLRFDGMFAGALHDRERSRHLLFRDPLGQKPLYYCEFNGGLVYASELRALLALDGFRWRLNRPAFLRYLSNGYYAWDETPVEGVRKLLPGCLLEMTERGTRLERYWDSVPGEDLLDLTEDEAFAEFERLFAESCARSMRSDVPLGVFLSGGLDSSLVLAFSREIRSDVRAFSVAMGERDFDESAKAERVARHLGLSDHHSFIMGRASVESAMRGVLTSCDEPNGDPGFVNTYFLAQACRPHLTVALAGDGGDELFAGYLPFASLHGEVCLRVLPSRVLEMIRTATTLLPNSDRYLGLRFKAEAYVRGFPSSPATRFALWLASVDPEALARLCPWQKPGFSARDGAEGSVYDFVERLMTPVQSGSRLQQLLYFYQKVFLPEFVCMHTDRGAMQFGLEVRAPFLSPSVIRFANRLPDHMKVRGGTLKWILRRVATRRGLPSSIARQPKQGFTFPLARWLKTTLRPCMEELLSHEGWRDERLVDLDVVHRCRTEHLAGTRDHSRLLYSLMAFRAWRQNFPTVEV